MGFRDNLVQKIQINDLAQSIVRDLGPPDSGQRINVDDMRRLVEMGPYRHRRERDLDLYLLDETGSLPHVLVLDNELKIYHTTVEDVVLRKSPTVKEMVNIRNAIKILNDKDVVVTRKAETVQRIQDELIDALDLEFSPGDIESLAADGRAALQNNYTDGIAEACMLFAELLGYRRAPRAFQANHYRIWGKLDHQEPGIASFGPVLMLDLTHNEVKMINSAFSSSDKAAVSRYREVIKGTGEPDLKGQAVFAALQKTVVERSAP